MVICVAEGRGRILSVTKDYIRMVTIDTNSHYTTLSSDLRPV